MSSELLSLTGMPSPGKARLLHALQRAGIVVSQAGTLRVHAETDLEALVEPGFLDDTRVARAQADIVIPVDWESPEDSVRRVIAALSTGAHGESSRAGG